MHLGAEVDFTIFQHYCYLDAFNGNLYQVICPDDHTAIWTTAVPRDPRAAAVYSNVFT